jgi:transposase InsO family protein
MYEDLGNAGVVCRRCGISRPTLRKWLQRFKEEGLEGLESRSRRPLTSPARKVTEEHEAWVLQIRRDRKLGARRIQSELLRLHECRLSLATIHKILRKHQVKPLQRRRSGRGTTRYSRPIPGERVQMDVCKIAPGLYQFTAIDDCTRYRVLGLYARRSAKQTLHFLERLLEEMPFPIQRIQTDRGREFFATKVQERLMSWGIKFRPIRPASPHLNGKVERSQKTDLHEFYPTIDLKDPELEDRLAEWQHYYNWQRSHGSLGGKTPMEKYIELMQKTPYWDEVCEMYDPTRERIQEANYSLDLKLRRLKGSL